MARKARARTPSGGLIASFVLVFMILSVFALPMLVAFGVGMLPTLVAAITDRDPEKLAPLAIGPLNFAGTLAVMLDIFQGGNSMAAMGSTLSSPFNWLIMYGAAGIGWSLYVALPGFTSQIVARRAEQQIEELVQRQREIVSEWGPEVAGTEALEYNEPEESEGGDSADEETDEAEPVRGEGG